MNFYAKLTPKAAAKIAAAQAGGENLHLTDIAVGDGNGHPVAPPTGTETALMREVYRGQVSALYVNPNDSSVVMVEMTIPSMDGGWAVREVGLYDVDGDLCAYGNFPETYKPVAAEGSTREMVIVFAVRVASSSVIDLIIDTSVVLASRAWVLSSINRAHIIPGGLTNQILAKNSNADGDTEWIDISEGIQVLVDIVEETQTLAEAQSVVTFATVSTNGLAVFVDGQRLILGKDYTVTSATQITLITSYDGGSTIHCYQNDPLEAPQYLRPGLNFSDVSNSRVARKNLGVLSKTNSFFMGQN